MNKVGGKRERGKEGKERGEDGEEEEENPFFWHKLTKNPQPTALRKMTCHAASTISFVSSSTMPERKGSSAKMPVA